MTSDAPALRYAVSVRELAAFTAKAGDLDLRFTPAPTALEGLMGHARVQSRRGPTYESEKTLSETYEILHVRGRADGYWPERRELEEIKTYRGTLARIPDNHKALHWAQLKLYGAMLCRAENLPEVKLTLVYFDIVREKKTFISEVHRADSLRHFFEEHARRFLDWALQQSAHRLRRNAHLQALSFPFPEMHEGQRILAKAVYRHCRDGGTLLAQAPTGIGKTLGTLFPALKATARGQLDRIFFLTAKTSGRRLALDALQGLRPSARAVAAGQVSEPGLRVLELVARDKACVHPDKACHGGSCPLAQGFYDRLPAARQAAQSLPSLDQTSVRDLAQVHSICPYYLGQELARWSDVIVGDVNYYFDQNALLYGLTVSSEWKIAVLVDEAHNLLERGRGMYSAELIPDRLHRVRKLAPKALKRSLDAVRRAWTAAHALQTEPYQVHAALPATLLDALGIFSSAVTDFLTDEPDGLAAEVQSFYFDVLKWRALAESFGPHSLFDVGLKSMPRGVDSATLCIRNVVPAPFLTERLAAAHSTILFSATLTPATFYRAMLGLPARTVELTVPSPFQPHQLEVTVTPQISTRFADREHSIEPIAELIARQFSQRPGNYLAFFSSFEYLDAVVRRFRQQHSDIPLWCQSRGMPELDRQAFLDRFVEDGAGIGFAVLGGAFAEAVDLPGTRLIGAFVATLGLPQVNPVNEEFRKRLDGLFGGAHGYDYVYLYPGLQKVVQACGRVIRTTEDRGCVFLVDDRYQKRYIQALLPSWWRLSIRCIRSKGRSIPNTCSAALNSSTWKPGGPKVDD